ncbi:hypothetical protein [Flavobacterium sp. NKUCC04_CG]|nr:hypothetical protein [Flavobacterium sp. NKUCC04_CG]MBW3518913.1 hypothetical protein [Flavobacterium sp. NKUCC04_CG]
MAINPIRVKGWSGILWQSGSDAKDIAEHLTRRGTSKNKKATLRDGS